MGYFNYFIKCIIRKFVNLLFKPKMLIIFLILICMLFVLQTSSRANWDDYDIAYVLESFANITTNQGTAITLLGNVGADVSDMRNKLILVQDDISMIRAYASNINNNIISINTKVNSVVEQLNSISTNISSIYNTLEENQKELLTELEEDNQAVLEELNMIRDAINGTEEEQTSYIDNGIVYCGDKTSTLYKLKSLSLNYAHKFTYTIKIYYKQGSTFSYAARVYATDNVIPQNYLSEDYWSDFNIMGNVPSGTSVSSFTYIVPSTNPKYIYFGATDYIEKIEVYRSIKGIVESLNDSNSLQQEQNQLQQQQNQLQQEQNDFLTKPNDDNDVSVDSFNSVDSNDITSSGLTGVFNNIYSSITSWNAKNINLPIPYTNKSITIPANYTENMLNSSGGGWIVNFIHAVYYFIVGRFMIYSITNIVNSIKSGSILNTDSKNNITTDML